MFALFFKPAVKLIAIETATVVASVTLGQGIYDIGEKTLGKKDHLVESMKNKNIDSTEQPSKPAAMWYPSSS